MTSARRIPIVEKLAGIRGLFSAQYATQRGPKLALWLAACAVVGVCSTGTPRVDAAGGAIPTGYWVDVDESGTTTSSGLGGGGSLSATGTGNVNYGWGEECAPSSDGGPFSSGHYPPATCPEVGRAYSSTGSPENPPGFWFTGNDHCTSAARAFSGSEFVWHVQLPQTGPWHVDVYVPNWTSYGWGNQYILTAADGHFESAGFIQQASHGSWVPLFGSHRFNAGQDYTVQLTQADTSDANCHYQMADQMKWVYDGATVTTPVNTAAPSISGKTSVGQVLTASEGSWTESPTSYAYQWEDCNGAGGECAPIAGATSQSYTLVAGDLGHRVLVQLTASNQAGASAPAESATVGPIVSTEQEEGELSTFVPINSADPTVSGTAVVGQTLTEHHGQWSNSPTSYRIQWERCTSSGSCAPIAGATSANYQLIAADATHELRVSETAVNAAGSSATISSRETDIVSLPPFQPERPCATAAAHAAGVTHGPDLYGIGQADAVDSGRVTRAHSKKRHHGTLSLSKALRETVGTSRRFTINLGLTPAVQTYLGETCPHPLTGSGTVNFKRRTAVWSVKLPPRIGGHVSVFAARRAIYVSSTLLGSSHQWVALRRPSDYVALDRIPLLRDIVVATDPLGSISLLNSAHGHASVHGRGRRASLAKNTAVVPIATLASDQSKSISTSCNNGQQVSDGSDSSKQLTDTLSVGTTAESDMLTNWVKNKISAEGTQHGLCEVKVSLENADNNGFDVTIEFSNPIPPAHISAAGIQDAITYTQTYHFREACFVGMWEGEDKAFLPAFVSTQNTEASSSTGTGTVQLSMTQQAATLNADEVFEGDYTHPSVEFITLPDGGLGTEEVPLTVPYTFTRTIHVSGPVTLTGEDGISLELTGHGEGAIERFPFIPESDSVALHLEMAGTVTCPSSLTLNDQGLGQIVLHKTSSTPGLPVLTKTEESWQQQLQALPNG